MVVVGATIRACATRYSCCCCRRDDASVLVEMAPSNTCQDRDGQGGKTRRADTKRRSVCAVGTSQRSTFFFFFFLRNHLEASATPHHHAQ